jgi:CBS domain-containing protein
VGEETLIVDAGSAAGYTVRDAMVKRPKALPASATIADLRRLFENPKVRTALIVDDGRFLGAVERDDVPAAGGDDLAPALGLAPAGVQTVGPDDALPAALDRLGRTAERRLVVVDADGRLAGLLCPNEDGTSFCLDPRTST